MRTIESYIKKHALDSPSKIAIVSEGIGFSYSQLQSKIDDCVTLLHSRGIKSGDAITLVAHPTIDYLVMYFAIHSIGGVAVPLAEDVPSSMLDEIEKQLKGASLPQGSADILFTTGTTGKAKGVIISHKTIIANSENLIDAQKYSREQVFIICGPLNHAGCWTKVFPIMMLGSTLYLIPGMKDVNLFFDALDYDSAKLAAFLVPASIKILLQFSQNRLEAYSKKIDFIETGAAAITKNDMEQLCKTLPYSRLYNTYASTETGIIATYDFSNNECIEGCLGRPMKHSSICISKEGTIICNGDTLMTGYFNDESLTRTILKEDGLHTSDMGYLDENGNLRLIGRKDDIINIGGYKVDPAEVEKTASELSDIQDCICIAASHSVIGTVLKLNYIVDKQSVISKKDIAKYLSSKLERYKVPTLYECVDKINKTFNGKLDRKSYR